MFNEGKYLNKLALFCWNVYFQNVLFVCFVRVGYVVKLRNLGKRVGKRVNSFHEIQRKNENKRKKNCIIIPSLWKMVERMSASFWLGHWIYLLNTHRFTVIINIHLFIIISLHSMLGDYHYSSFFLLIIFVLFLLCVFIYSGSVYSYDDDDCDVEMKRDTKSYTHTHNTTHNYICIGILGNVKSNIEIIKGSHWIYTHLPESNYNDWATGVAPKWVDTSKKMWRKGAHN